MKKVYCKRTCFYEANQLPEYWNKRVKWEKNKIYETKPVNSDIEASIIFIYIETETFSYYAPTNKKEFEMYFMTIEEARDKKINNILNE
jgi:hypothetical protein